MRDMQKYRTRAIEMVDNKDRSGKYVPDDQPNVFITQQKSSQ